MPTCLQCGTHWFNPAIHKCPVCGHLTVDRLASNLSDKLLRSVSDLLQNLGTIGQKLVSEDPVVRKAALEVLAKAQTREAFDLLLSSARKANGFARYDTLCALYHYPQYAHQLVPFLIEVVSEPDDGTHCRSMAITVIGNLGQAGIECLHANRAAIPHQESFWEGLISAARHLAPSDVEALVPFISRELRSGNIDAEALAVFLRVHEEPWFPTSDLVERALGILDTHDEAVARTAAANVLFHCASAADKARARLALLQRDNVLGIRCRAVQICSTGRPSGGLEITLCDAANLEAIVERGADDLFESREQLVKRIEKSTGQSFVSPEECLDWVRKNCYPNT